MSSHVFKIAPSGGYSSQASTKGARRCANSFTVTSQSTFHLPCHKIPITLQWPPFYRWRNGGPPAMISICISLPKRLGPQLGVLLGGDRITGCWLWVHTEQSGLLEGGPGWGKWVTRSCPWRFSHPGSLPVLSASWLSWGDQLPDTRSQNKSFFPYIVCLRCFVTVTRSWLTNVPVIGSRTLQQVLSPGTLCAS
jgi:hypothetical protein